MSDFQRVPIEIAQGPATKEQWAHALEEFEQFEFDATTLINWPIVLIRTCTDGEDRFVVRPMMFRLPLPPVPTAAPAEQ